MASPEWRAITGVMRDWGIGLVASSALVFIGAFVAPDTSDIRRTMIQATIIGGIVGGAIYLIGLTGRDGQTSDYF